MCRFVVTFRNCDGVLWWWECERQADAAATCAMVENMGGRVISCRPLTEVAKCSRNW